MEKFDYDRAESDLYEAGCFDSEEIYSMTDDKSRRDLMDEFGLDPADYYEKDNFKKNTLPSSVCYLTTACVTAENLPDDCPELQTLRAFRDGYLKHCESGEEEIAEYYATAPQIVFAVNNRADADCIWKQLYRELVLPSVALICDGKNEEAHILYRNIARRLQKEYLN